MNLAGLIERRELEVRFWLDHAERVVFMLWPDGLWFRQPYSTGLGAEETERVVRWTIREGYARRDALRAAGPRPSQAA